ncbi:MAG TPA: DNA double-strand break repair nuclease NurA [Anaerolineae bacterium]
MALELNKLTQQVGQMGEVMAARRRDHDDRVGRAREALALHGTVTDDLREKIATARRVDESWRGADPYPWSDRLDLRRRPGGPPVPATLIAVDGSQIYPDRHDIAPYYLINVGSVILRQDSGQAPAVSTEPELHFNDDDLYDDAGRLRQAEYVNARRAERELDRLVELAEAERMALGGDLDRPILALSDGPLLPWQSQRRRAGATGNDLDEQLSHFIQQLDRLCALHVIPIGYVDRPSSANVLRTLELADLPGAGIDRQTVRHGRYRLLTDRLLLGNLAPNERSGLFASTSELNERLGRAGTDGQRYQAVFFYLNVARPATGDQTQRTAIGRVELPTWEWVIGNPAMLDLVQNALYTDCELTRYPYVLARAHEEAVVGNFEKANLEAMLQQIMWRHGLPPLASEKAANKQQTGSRRR